MDETKLEKAKERLKSKPTDYTFTEAKSLLGKLGFEEKQKGKTSGSRVAFFRSSDGAFIMLHKPHPGNELKEYSVKDLIEKLEEYGEL